MPAAITAPAKAVPIRTNHPEGRIEVASIQGRRYRVKLVPNRQNLFIPRTVQETDMPLGAIHYLIQKSSYDWLCDTISRYEEVPRTIERQLSAYLSPEDFSGKRILDFGCGKGASAMGMALLFPTAEVIGLELDGGLVEIAQHIAGLRKVPNVRFLKASSADRLPPDIGLFDFVMLSAVYEHLLPIERTTVMPQLWSVMKPGGVLFINQTPHRYFPWEHHSTGLWLINYLPDRLAHLVARKLSRINPLVNRSLNWDDHLRGGIRGATEKEILRSLCGNPPRGATVLQPCRNGLRDRAGYWLSGTNPRTHLRLKRMIALLFRLADRYLGTIPSMNVDMAIRKVA